MMIISFILYPDAFAQEDKKTDYLNMSRLPAGLTLPENHPCKYGIVTDYYNHDILGIFLNKTQVKGIYTRGLKGGKVSWNDVTVAQAAGREDSFPAGEKQEYMENFTYVPSDKMVSAEPFKDFPAINGIFAKNLVWDVMGFEVFAWEYYDSLEINIPFNASRINGEVDLAGMGKFENKNIQLTWTGLSILNQEPCAVIEFLAMDNPLNFDTDFVAGKGRSHYWGTIWLSLTDKQIEHAVLYEDVNMEMKFSGQDKSRLTNTTRKIDFIKLKSDL